MTDLEENFKEISSIIQNAILKLPKTLIKLMTS